MSLSASPARSSAARSSTAATSARTDVGTDSRRLIAVGVRHVRHDGDALRWAVREARPGRDSVQVVHAFAVPGPAGPDGSETGVHHLASLRGWEVVAAAVEHASRQRPEVAVIGSPTAGAPEEVLAALSDEVAMLVIGDDEPSTPDRHIAAYLQQVAACPVVCVPRGSDGFAELPVSLVADDLGLSPATLRFAATEALRHGVNVQVVRTWGALHRDGAPLAATVAEEQELLDEELVDLRRDYPHLALVSRIELHDGWLARVREHSSLVVAGRTTARRLGLVSPLPEPLCPVAFVPEQWSGAGM